MPKIGAASSQDRTEAEEKPKAPANASLRGTSGKSKDGDGDYKATPEDVDVAMGVADPPDGDWDALAIPVNIDKKRHVYRGSLVGGCVTSLVALQLKDKLGLEVSEELPKNIQAAAQAGTDAEAAIITKFCAEFGYRKANYQNLATLRAEGVIAGYNPEMDQIQVRADIGKKAVLRSHPDAFVTHITGDVGAWYDLEVKFLGPDLFKQFKKKGLDGMGDVGVKYAWQISARMGTHGCPLIFVAAEKLGGNTDSEVGELIPVVFQPDEIPVPWKQITKKIKKCEEYVKEGVLPDECGKGTFGCPAFKLPQCKNPDATERVRETLDDIELGDLLRLQFAYNTDKKEAETALKPVNAAIRKIMEARYPKALDYAYTVKDAPGNEFVWEWIEYDRAGYTVDPSTVSYSKIVLTGKAEEKAG